MKKITTRIATALHLGLVCASPAFAKVKSRTITVGQDFAVGGTVVKAGTYRFSFDDQKNELTVADRKSKEVIARAETRVQARGKGPFKLDVQLVDNNGTKALASIAFDGEKNSYTIAAGSTAAVREVHLVAVHAMCAALDAVLRERGQLHHPTAVVAPA